MTGIKYSLHGTVLQAGTNQPVENLRVEIWVKMPAQDKRLGEATTDRAGNFTFTFRQCYLVQLFSGRSSELFFQLFKGEEAIALASTPTVVWESATGWNQTASIQLQAQLPVSEPTYTVRGTVRDTEGHPLPNCTVQIYDLALSSETLLAETTTNVDGDYRLDYHPATDKSYIDREIRVLDDTNSLLYRVSISRTQLRIQQNFGAEPLPPSEYQQLLDNLAPFLNGIPFADLTLTQLALLAAKSDLDRNQLVDLRLSQQLASETQLPTEIFYGLLRQGLPSQLLPLLDLDPQTWRTALETALDRNIIPSHFRAELDTYLEQLEAIATAAKQDDESSPSESPRIYLNPRHLHRSVLANLTANDRSHTYLNQILNTTLKQVLSDSLANQGHIALATLVKTMPDADLGETAETSVRDFIADRVERALDATQLAELRTILTDSISTLSSTTTIGQLLGIDAPLETHPLFERTAKLTRFHSLLDTSALQGDRPRQTALLAKYRARDGSIQDFWKSLREDSEFGAETVADLQLTFQLGTLTGNNASLVRALRDRVSSPNANASPTLRQLTQLNLQDWKAAIQQTAEGDQEDPDIPDDIAGETPDERLTNYARLLMRPIEQAFPTDFVAKTVIHAPQVHPTPLHQFLEQHPDLNLLDTLPEDLELPEELAILQQEIRQYPDFDYRTALSRFNGNGNTVNLKDLNSIRQNVAQFFHDAPDFDFRAYRVKDYLDRPAEGDESGDNRSEIAFRNIPQAERLQVRQQLKRMQRVFEIAPQAASVETLLKQGFHSAYSVCQMPYNLFMRSMGDRLGWAIASKIYQAAQNKIVKVLSRIIGAYQHTTDWLPFVLGDPKLFVLPDLNNDELSDRVPPEWRHLFGNIDLCDCKHCRSVYSPSAYFVELLELLRKGLPNKQGKHPLAVLRQRRPDLMHVNLTCENAETPLPYIDLVNEILEYVVAHNRIDRNAAQNTQDVSAAELKVNPQYTNDKAYQNLRVSFYPFSLPFDRDVETARLYL